MSDTEIINFCMIPMKNNNGKFDIFPLPQHYCHCRNSDKKHFTMKGSYNEDKTNMTPSNPEDVERLTEYCKNLENQ